MVRCPPRVALAVRTSRWGFHTVRGGIDPWANGFRPRFVGVVDMWKDSDPGIGPYPPRMALDLRTPGWSFHTVRCGIDPGGHRFRPRFACFLDA